MKRKWLKCGIWVLAALFALMNIVAAFHAYKFTRFTDCKSERTKDPKSLKVGEKVSALIFGVSNPRPKTKAVPASNYQTVKLKSNKEIECWSIKVENPQGTVILFHGFSDEKSSLLGRADVFRELGFNTFLVDFMGSGGSEGNQTTVGFWEAMQVKTCFDHLTENGEDNIYLFGSSMGAVAIMKAISDYGVTPKGIIIECPFGSMYQTVCARFRTMNVPAFPMAGLLTFWGGLQNGFWAFAHNPADYAKKITCPTLLLYGAKDEKVSRRETNAIFNNLGGEKRLKLFQEAGHEDYLEKCREEWVHDIRQFLTPTSVVSSSSTSPDFTENTILLAYDETEGGEKRKVITDAVIDAMAREESRACVLAIDAKLAGRDKEYAESPKRQSALQRLNETPES